MAALTTRGQTRRRRPVDRWEFLVVVAAPPAVEGGTGLPLNPLAIF